jgi:hypothetical protein
MVQIKTKPIANGRISMFPIAMKALCLRQRVCGKRMPFDRPVF